METFARTLASKVLHQAGRDVWTWGTIVSIAIEDLSKAVKPRPQRRPRARKTWPAGWLDEAREVRS